MQDCKHEETQETASRSEGRSSSVITEYLGLWNPQHKQQQKWLRAGSEFYEYQACMRATLMPVPSICAGPVKQKAIVFLPAAGALMPQPCLNLGQGAG